MNNDISIACFSMEIALESAIPTYSGGLGVLAGDTLRSAADAHLSMAGVTLLSRKGYFRQRLDEQGWQSEEPVNWPVDDYLLPMDAEAIVELDDRRVTVRAWRYDLKGCDGHIVPVYLLDTDVENNSDYDRTLTDHLYGGDDYYRLCQELLLGVGGEFPGHAIGMGQVQNDQFVDHLRDIESKLPGNYATPIMTDNGSLFFTQVINHRGNIRYQILHVIVAVAFGLITQVVTTLIDCDDPVIIFQAFHLMAPAIPEIRKAMDHYHQWPFANSRIVDLHAIAVCIAVRDFVPDICINSIAEQQRYSEHKNT